MKNSIKFLFLAIALLHSSCSYRWNGLNNDSNIPILSIPYIEGDEDGSFTSELVRTITSLGIAKVQKFNQTYTLKVLIQDTGTQTIGYRWDKQKVSGELKDNIVDCEARRSLKAEVSLIDPQNLKVLMGPFTVETTADYDYVDGDCIHDLQFTNSYGIKTLVLPFSLGQLEPKESALEASTKPLSKKLSQKIADCLFTNM